MPGGELRPQNLMQVVCLRSGLRENLKSRPEGESRLRRPEAWPAASQTSTSIPSHAGPFVAQSRLPGAPKLMGTRELPQEPARRRAVAIIPVGKGPAPLP
jgi:hypothetical protein